VNKQLGIMAFLTFSASPIPATDQTYDASPSLTPCVSRGFLVNKSEPCGLTSQYGGVVDG
jgi:hypothetical protein